MSYKATVLKDDIIHIKADYNNCTYHEVEIESQWKGELESVTIDKTTGKIVVRLKEDKGKRILMLMAIV